MQARLLRLAAATALLVAACSLPAASRENSLLLWVGGDGGHVGLQAVADWFAAESGVEVVVERPAAATDRFQQAAASGDGPDIFIGFHDHLGIWAAAGLIAPIEPSETVRESILDFAWEAVTLDGRTWGYPIAADAIGLIYNRDRVPTPPTSFEEIFSMELPDGVNPILWDYDNPYFTMPLLLANGGFVFAKDETGTYDTSVTGLNNDGAKQGAGMLRRLLDEGVMPGGADYRMAQEAMKDGAVAMTIDGPWAWTGLAAAGIDFGVAPLPSVAGQPARSFVGVRAAAITAASPDLDLAVEFIENYLLSDKGLQAIARDAPLGAVVDRSVAETLAADGNWAATLASARAGVPMPATAAMSRFWASMGPALASITSGRQTVEEALDGAAQRILAAE